MPETTTQLTLFNIADVVQSANDKWQPVPPLKRGNEQKNDSVTTSQIDCYPNDSVTTLDVTESSSKPRGISEFAISTYKPRGEARGQAEYFRFSYRDGKRIRHVHIPGGNCHSPMAIAHRNMVRAMIQCGDSVEEILEEIKEWGRR
ncbi:MAG TPA: hypothetical protein V6C95_23450 [Coleofasciculaceae cyanobacterium]